MLILYVYYGFRYNKMRYSAALRLPDTAEDNHKEDPMVIKITEVKEFYVRIETENPEITEALDPADKAKTMLLRNIYDGITDSLPEASIDWKLTEIKEEKLEEESKGRYIHPMPCFVDDGEGGLMLEPAKDKI